jgi:hypothetical protein
MTRLLPPLLAIGFTLIGATDWGLTTAQGTDCAVDQASCELAISAIRHGWIQTIPRDTPTRCDPRPGCRDPASEVIRGFNDK